MALKIRLARGGSKKRPYYRIVVADGRMPRDGRYIEKIGAYNPLLPKDNEARVILDTDKAGEWLKKGAQPSDRVARFLGEKGLLTYKPSNNPKKAEPGEKAKERAAERAEKEAAANAPAEETAAEEAPAEEAAAEDSAEA